MAAERIVRIAVVTALGVSFVVALSGCQRAVESAVEQATGIRVEEDGDRVTITGGEDGEEFTMEGSGAALPDDWPSDVPIYPGAELDSSTTLRMGDATQMAVSWRTTDDVGAIYDWYKAELPAAGWEITGDFSIEQDGQRTANLSSEKGSTSANVFIGDESGGVAMVSIQVRVE